MLLGINKEIDASVLAKMIYMAELPDIEHVMQFEKLGCSAWATTFRMDALLCNGSEQSYFLKVNSTHFGSNLVVNRIRFLRERMVESHSEANSNLHQHSQPLHLTLSLSQ